MQLQAPGKQSVHANSDDIYRFRAKVRVGNGLLLVPAPGADQYPTVIAGFWVTQGYMNFIKLLAEDADLPIRRIQSELEWFGFSLDLIEILGRYRQPKDSLHLITCLISAC